MHVDIPSFISLTLVLVWHEPVFSHSAEIQSLQAIAKKKKYFQRERFDLTSK